MKFITPILTVLLCGNGFAAAPPLPVAGTWQASDAGVRVGQDAGMTELTFVPQKDSQWPEARIPFSADLTQYNTLSFTVEASAPGAFLILYDPRGARDIIGLSNAMEVRSMPVGKQIDFAWNFVKVPGWISGGGGTFDFSRVTTLGIGYNAAEIPAGQPVTVRFSTPEFSYHAADAAEQALAAQRDAYIAALPQGTTEGKKVIGFCFYPVTGGMACLEDLAKPEVWREFAGLPFDGLYIEALPMPFRDRVFCAGEYPDAAFDAALAAGRKIDFGRFTENFLRIDIVSQQTDADGNVVPVDWFDETVIQAIERKAHQLGRLALELDFAGIGFDNEAYTPDHPYDYVRGYQSSGRSFEEYREQVRRVGARFAAALGEEAPGIDIMLLFGNSSVRMRELAEDRHALLPALIDGMLSIDSVNVIDGFEDSYEYWEPELFRDGLWTIDYAARWSSDPARYRERLGRGFGIWFKNPAPVSEETFRTGLQSALENSDRYVWIYTEGYPRPDYPASYLEVIRGMDR